MDTKKIFDELRNQIAGVKSAPEVLHVGVVAKVYDVVAIVRGLSKVRFSEIVEFEVQNSSKKVFGVAQNLEEDSVGVIILGDVGMVSEGQSVRSTGEILSIPCGPELVGRVVNPLGEPIDGGPQFALEKMKRFPLEKVAPGVITRESVKIPLHTGLKAIDGMIPIGRGQRELIIGDRQTGKTAIAIDTIINQKNETKNPRPICIYVAIGQKESKIAQIVERLKKSGAMEYTIVVVAGAASGSALQYLSPYAGCAIGEYFMSEGKDALVIYDDLTKHAWAYREISLLLRRPPGREAYPGDIFYLHSKLLERAAKLNKEFGGGSLTALPIIETQQNDISAYIPTNVISITDGQIYLESELFYQGIRPAVNVGLSVSRVGSSAQTKAMKKVAGTLRLELAQFRELAAFAQFGQDLDAETRKKIDRGERLTELLKQAQFSTLPFEEESISIFSAVNGFLDSVPVDAVQKFEKELLKFIRERHKKLLETIRTSGEFSEESTSMLSAAIKDFGDNYFKQ